MIFEKNVLVCRNGVGLGKGNDMKAGGKFYTRLHTRVKQKRVAGSSTGFCR